LVADPDIITGRAAIPPLCQFPIHFTTIKDLSGRKMVIESIAVWSPCMRTPLLLIVLGIVIILCGLPACGAAAPLLTPGSAAAPTGTLVTIPLSLSAAEEPIGNLDLTLVYDPRILQATEVRAGDLAAGALIDSNLQPGRIRLGVVSRDGFRGDGIVAEISFVVTGSEGSTALQIYDLSANHAATLAPLQLMPGTGQFTILAGIRFDEEGGSQRVTVDLPVGANTTVDGDRIILVRPDLTFTIVTGGLASGASQMTGLVREVIVASPAVTADLSFGQVTSRFEFTLPRYPTESYFSLVLDEGTDPVTLSRIQEAAGKRALEITQTPFSAIITTRGYGKTGPATGYFTIPGSLLASCGGIDGVWFGHVSDYLGPELLKPVLKSGTDRSETVTLRVDSPEGLSVFVMASAKMKAIAHPEETPGATQTGLTLFGNMVFSIVTLSTGNLMVGAVMIGALVLITVVAIFYVHRKRGG
jgi:hypothetical protein